jgi:hypothetical protein
MTVQSLARVALLGALSVMSVACSGEQDGSAVSGSASDDSSAVEAFDACAIITREEAAAALGAPVAPGESSVANFTDYKCHWESEDGFGHITIDVLTGNLAARTDWFEYADGQPIDGIGDRAKWDDIAGLEVLTSKYEIGVTGLHPQQDRSRRQEIFTELARTVLARLP